MSRRVFYIVRSWHILLLGPRAAVRGLKALISSINGDDRRCIGVVVGTDAIRRVAKTVEACIIAARLPTALVRSGLDVSAHDEHAITEGCLARGDRREIG